MDIGYLAAIAGGLLALLSPCSALLLPSFFAYAFRDPARLLMRTGVFYAGLCLTLVPLGAGSALVSSVFYGHRETLIIIAGWTIIALGVAQLLGVGFTWGLPTRLQGRFSGRRGALPVFGLGAVYGLAGFCSGPILGAVLTVAATGTPVRGALLLACYALGMALPLFVLALLWDRFDLGRRTWLRGRVLTIGRLRLHTNSTVSGLLFIGIGVLFLVYDGTASMTALPGMGWLEDVAYRVQEPLSQLGVRADLVFLVLLALVLLGVAGHRARRSRSSRGRDAIDASKDGHG
ncbi:cytochrome c biogenesis protein CcdA [Spinactinospora alkalitolerans]|uniref:Cytochrome c biogenesis protein CcdA n=1 Tax=Spinactinospora alkalitolerans TaxID=687207 RepID=A0A852TX38_9ACTN|nr:cytochrome c biogenesis CcdA family protein [Spinactinospora alkalitolerans]NYE47867.1 cytochrome c biogenesis protein CcdA [Spinactinospora alkalitolerans]